MAVLFKLRIYFTKSVQILDNANPVRSRCFELKVMCVDHGELLSVTLH